MYTRAAEQFFKHFLADDVTAQLILELRLPVEAHRATNVAGIVGFGVHVNLGEFDAGFVEVLFDPVGFDQDFRM